MKVLYIHQYFKTPDEGGAIRSFYIAAELARRGIQIEMITAHNRSGITHRFIDGISVNYLPVYYTNTLNPWRRYLAFFKFAGLAIYHSQRIRNVDLAYITSTPLTVGLVALWLRRWRKVPYVFEVRDLWPEAPIQLGMLKPKLTQQMALRLEKAVYANASHIVALSPGIKEGIMTKWDKTTVTVVPNMADIDFYKHCHVPDIQNPVFTIGYFGALGKANGLEAIIQIASVCQARGLAIRFVITGEGSERASLSQSVEQKRLSNVEFLSAVGKEQMASIMKRVDACFISFLKIPILETCSPNKFFDALAAGKLCIVNTDGWLRNLVQENKCGFYTDPTAPDGFPELIKPFLTNRQLLVQCQQNAYLLGKTQFSKDDLTGRIYNLIARFATGNQ